MKTSLIKNKSAWIVFAYDVCSALLAWAIVHALIWNRISGFAFSQFVFVAIAFAISTKIFRTYASLWKTVSAADLKRNIYSVILGTALFFGLEFIANRMGYIARSEVLFYPVLTLLISLAGRFFYRQYLWRIRKKHAKKIILIGGGAGANLFLCENELLTRPYNIVGIFDDNKSLHGKLLRNNMIVGSVESLAKDNFLVKYPADEVLIAIPSLDKIKLQELYQRASVLGLPVKILPSLMEITHGAKLTDLQEIEVEDLLGRDQVMINLGELKGAYLDKTVLVTGGAGSIGSEICRQLLRKSSPKALIVLDHSEYNLYQIEKELNKISHQVSLQFILASVTDERALLQLFQSNCIDVVFHAAAYKHVPLLENQPKIAIQNNIIGTKNIVDLSSQYKVERFLLVSTDKAVNPTNVMGATKRIAELYVNTQKNEHTKFMVTRFGNVLGSAGSVVPLFKKQLQEGGPLTVTHKDIERYFMTIPEASLLVVLSCAIGNGGETFVLEMGDPVKIVELAEQMIKLSGRKPYVDIDIHFTGLRPGEKMYEELFYLKEELRSSGFDKLLVGQSIHLGTEKMNGILKMLSENSSRECLLKVIASLNSALK